MVRFPFVVLALLSTSAAALFGEDVMDFVPVMTGFTGPTQIVSLRDGSGRFLVAEHRGTIQLVDPKSEDQAKIQFLDIRARVFQRPKPCCDEQGLLGLTLPPGDGPKDHFFVSYVDPDSHAVVSRFSINLETGLADPDSETVLQKLLHTDVNHFAGTIAFSPIDGLLYWTVGDGSAGNDVVHAQNPTDPFGKVLRFNPYSDSPKLEIYASGLRNPWRFSFDQQTGDLFIGDVGENTFEELNHVPAGTPPGTLNFGWGIMEGYECYEFQPCNKEGLTTAAFVFDHDKGCSVTAGEAYYGELHPEWTGRYFFADFCKGTIWSTKRGEEGWDTIEHVYWPNIQISTFGIAEDREILLASYTRGIIYRLSMKPMEEPEPDPGGSARK